jgi:Uma2 family endonuclease
VLRVSKRSRKFRSEMPFIPSVGHRTKPNGVPAPFHFSVDRYHEMIRTGVLTENDRVELINGRIVDKMPINPPHKTSLRRLMAALYALPLSDMVIDSQGPVVLVDSEPEPDVSISIGPEMRYADRHPTAGEVVLIIEIANSSLVYDSTTKLGVYAGVGIPIYWIVNLIDKQVEVFTKPKGGKKPGYGKRTIYKKGDDVPVMIAGKKRGTIAVSAILP